MPIHQTKLMMSNAHPTGWLLPQIPMPFTSSQPTETIRPFSSMKPMKNAMYHGIGCRPRSTTLLIFSVTEESVWPRSEERRVGNEWRVQWQRDETTDTAY